MATKKTVPTYIPQGVPTEISATSRCSIKINDNFYTIEAAEKRTILNPEVADMNKEWEDLFNSVNSVTDNQTADIIKTFKRK